MDLESFLIRFFAGDGHLTVLNKNAGITDADYYDRPVYQETFEQVFERLRTHESLFLRTIPQIINSDLFKLSPFKALNHEQAGAVEDILEGLFEDLDRGESSTMIVQGRPGTGKTIVAIYLLKLLEDIRAHDPEEPLDSDSVFSDFFTPGCGELLQGLRIGMVVPQQSLRESISRVFARIPGLKSTPVLTPFQVGESDESFDLLIVDEAHRLSRRANQPSGPLNTKFSEITTKLFGEDDLSITQLDWIRKQSAHVILMLDVEQSVRPADLAPATTRQLTDEVSQLGRVYRLHSQMRISADQDYVGYVRAVLSGVAPMQRQEFDTYDLRMFDDLGEMRREILSRNEEHGLARLVAGYAWAWKTKKDKLAFDIELDGVQLRWNSTQRDWINKANSELEVGSIHTVQGYDLNYAGVIIGKDLRFDPGSSKIYFDRAEYYDTKGQENNPKLGIVYSDEDLLVYVRNIYSVLLTRGIHGTYLYVCDEPLREHLRRYF